MSTLSREELQGLFRSTVDLSPQQRLIVMLYASIEPEASGAVRRTSADLAELSGYNSQSFSRARKDVIRAGYLVEVPEERVGVVRYYALSPKALGREDDTLPAAA
ncbi:replication initiation protein, RepL2 [Streptomyces sp. NPDC060005]|uniref:replication initiation protein, RepL2 n=1 Tax=Streptomyces sp. NPDC060005 TaxID=3347034 RepID=UPI0036A35468